MPIQPENKIFPHIFPTAPQNEEELLDWAQRVSLIYGDLTRQITEKFNLHVDQTHAHPKSWTRWRLRRPAHSYVAVDQVKVAASATLPALFLVGGRLLEATSDLTCDIDGTGPGGLDEGTKQPSTTYYLYGINNNGNPALIASDNAPTSGPTGYSDWTYIGSFATNGSSQIVSFTATTDPSDYK